MSHQPVAKAPAENRENEGGGAPADIDLESLGITRMLAETYVVGGYSYTNLADAAAQGRRMQKPETAL